MARRTWKRTRISKLAEKRLASNLAKLPASKRREKFGGTRTQELGRIAAGKAHVSVAGRRKKKKKSTRRA